MIRLAPFTSRTSRMVSLGGGGCGRDVADVGRRFYGVLRRPPVVVPPTAAATSRPDAKSKSISTSSSSFPESSMAPWLRCRASAAARSPPMRSFSWSSREIERQAGGATRSFLAYRSGDGGEGGGCVRAAGGDGQEVRGEKNRYLGRSSRRMKRIVGRYDDHNRNDAGGSGSGSASLGSLHAQPLTAAPFRPMREDGEEFDSFDEYIESVPLSPWVPTPDAVARRMLQLADAGPDDVHFDLGSGDGRLNLAAIERPFQVRRSVGVDIDANLIRVSNDRLAALHPRPTNVEFVCADLLDVPSVDGLGLEESTVLTMYFVEEALMKLRPVIEGRLGGTGCRVVTNGYPMAGWEAEWVEAVLGLSVHLYVMR